MFKHILIAHDLRGTADLALRRAAQLAQQHGASLTLLHVASPHLSSQELEQAHQTLDSSFGKFAPANSRLVVVSGKPGEVVLQQIQEQGADLLVLGSQQQRHPMLSGTTLEHIARHCSIPLLLASNEDTAPYPSALAALDFSIWACGALAKAYHLLPSGAQLHALNVFEPDKRFNGDAEAELAIQRQLIAKLLQDELQRLPEKGIQLSHDVQLGSLPRSLQDQIRLREAPLLVLGNRGRGAIASALANALLGNLAQHFLHKAPCDIFVAQ